jgi:hypothetical protein
MSGNTEDFTSDEVVNGDFKTEAAASKLSFFSVLRIRIGSGFHQVSGFGSGSRRKKSRKNKIKKLRNFEVLKLLF